MLVVPPLISWKEEDLFPCLLRSAASLLFLIALG